MRIHRTFVLVIALFMPMAAMARPYSASVPLAHGRLGLVSIIAVVRGRSTPAADVGPAIDLQKISGWVTVRAINAAMGDALQISISKNIATITVDAEKLPANWNQTCDALMRFTDVAAPEAAAAQRARMGLALPDHFDPSRRLVILVHGLDGDGTCCADLRDLITANGMQAAIFAYPGERPLEESSQFLIDQMKSLQANYSNIKVDFVAESMGSLIVRNYVEGSSYGNDVKHLIMIAPPNNGSTWASMAILSKIAVNASRLLDDEQWSPAWMINEGICQNAEELQPHSDFLIALDKATRRDGVQYTIIAGDKSPFSRLAADALTDVATVTPADAFGFSFVRRAVLSEAHLIDSHHSRSDGPVSLRSASLAGVNDFVVLHADHNALYESVDGQIPAAWDVVRARLID